MAGRGVRGRRRARSAGEAPGGGAPSPPMKRRSERNVASPAPSSFTEAKTLLRAASRTLASPHPTPFTMQPITLKKILPRNKQVKEMASTPRRSPRISANEEKENFCQKATKGKSPGRDRPKRDSEPHPLSSLNPEAGLSSGGKDVLSPITGNTSPPGDERDLTMSKRVRRSYSRLEVSFAPSFLGRPSAPRFGLSETSTPNRGPEKRQTLFGFEKLLATGGDPEVAPSNPDTTQKLSAAETETLLEPDPNIPGISLAREKRKKKKILLFNELELDEWVAQMNAEFEEAERFDLLVE